MSGLGSLWESFSKTGFEHLAPQRSPSRWDDEEGDCCRQACDGRC